MGGTSIHRSCARANMKQLSAAGSSLLSKLVEHCACEEPPLLASRVLDYESEVQSACYSSALLAVRTKQRLRVIRRDDWKTLVSVAAPPVRSCDLGLEVLEDKSLLITTATNGLSVLNLEARNPILVHTQGDEWQLKASENGLLTAKIGAATLRDLERPNLPEIATWRCNPLCLGNGGAIVLKCESQTEVSKQKFQWLDPRQSELVASNILCEY